MSASSGASVAAAKAYLKYHGGAGLVNEIICGPPRDLGEAVVALEAAEQAAPAAPLWTALDGIVSKGGTPWVEIKPHRRGNANLVTLNETCVLAKMLADSLNRETAPAVRAAADKAEALANEIDDASGGLMLIRDAALAFAAAVRGGGS